MFNQKGGAFTASLKTLSKTNPTIINKSNHLSATDKAHLLRDGDMFTVGERSFRFEYVPSIAAQDLENSTSHNLNTSSKKRRQSAKKKKSSMKKKLKRSVPTPLRNAIDARRVATPVAPAAPTAPTTFSMAPPAPVTMKSAKKSSKKKKRSIPTPLRSAIDARRSATPSKQHLVQQVAQVEELVQQVRSSKKQRKQKRARLATPVRAQIEAKRGANRGVTNVVFVAAPSPAAAAVTVVAGTKTTLPTPLRAAIDARRSATPAGSSKKKSKPKRSTSTKKSSKKKRKVATPLRAQIEARRVATPGAIVFVPNESLDADGEDETPPVEQHAMVPQLAKRHMATPLRNAIGAHRILTPEAPKQQDEQEEQEEEEENAIDQIFSAYKEKKRARLPTPLRQKITALRVVTPVAPASSSSSSSSLVVKGASTPLLLFGTDGAQQQHEEAYEYHEEDANELEDMEMMEEGDAVVVFKEKTPVKEVVFQGTKTTFSSPSPRGKNGCYKAHWTYNDYNNEGVTTPKEATTYNGLAEMMKTPVGLEKYYTEEEIQMADEEAAEIAAEEEESVVVEDVVEEEVVEEEVVEEVVQKEEDIVQEAVEEVVAPVEEVAVQEAEETFEGFATLKEIKPTKVADLRTFKVGQLMEAISFDDDDQVYDWFNCQIVGKYKSKKGVQIQFVDDDNVPEGKKEWTTRVQLRSDAAEQPVEEEEVDWSTFKVVELRAELKSRSLNTKGRKAELIARLEEHDLA